MSSPRGEDCGSVKCWTGMDMRLLRRYGRFVACHAHAYADAHVDDDFG